MGKAIEIKHPLVDHYVGVLRDINTDKNDFARAIENIVVLISMQITNNLKLSYKKVQTPLSEATVTYFDDNILLVPIMRAGLSMLEPLRKIIPFARFGYLGMKRNVKNQSVNMYYSNFPTEMKEYKVIILDVVIATGTTLISALNYLLEIGISQESITIINVLTSRQGLDKINDMFPCITLFTCKTDEILTDEGMIVPGLGDAGDRLNGYEVSE